MTTTKIPVMFALLAAVTASNQAFSREPCRLYEGVNFGGASGNIPVATQLGSLGSWDNRASSLTVPTRCNLIAYTGLQFNGDKHIFSPGRYSTLPYLFDNNIASARCFCN